MKRIFPWARAALAFTALYFCAELVRTVDAATTLTGLVTLPSPTLVQPGPIVSGQALRVGESIANTFDPRVTGLVRPVGSFVYTRAGTVAYEKIGTASTAWASVDGVPTSLSTGFNVATVTARAQALLFSGAAPDPRLTCFREDWAYNLSVPPYTNAPVGTAFQQNDTGNVVGGKLQIGTGATAASRSRTSQFGSILGRPDTNKFYYAARVAAVTAWDANAGFQVGIVDSGFTTAIAWGICGGTSTTNWTVQRDGGLCAGTNTASVISANTNFHVLELWGLGDGLLHTGIDFSETPAGSPFTLAASPTTSLTVFQQVTNGATAANRQASIDWYQVCWVEG